MNYTQEDIILNFKDNSPDTWNKIIQVSPPNFTHHVDKVIKVGSNSAQTS